MKTLTNSLFFALAFSAATLVSTVSASAGAPKPNRTVAYQVGVYSSADGTKINVAIDKEPGGRVDIILKDAKGSELFRQSMRKTEETYRGKLNVSSLTTGDYQLVISNGQKTTVRTLTITAPAPAAATRTLALL